MTSTQDIEKMRGLMMAALDNECSPEERRVLEQALDRDPELRREWLEMQKVKETTTMISVRKPPDEVWTDYWSRVYARVERGIAWLLVSIGAIVLLSWGAWEIIQRFLADGDTPLPVKLAIGALAVGAVILIVSVAREKLFVNRRDPYKDIER